MVDKRLLDKWWRINHLYFIKDKNKKLVQFKLNKAQTYFYKNAWYRNIILKSRQLGFTTLETIDTLDDVLFNRNFDGLFIAQNLDTAKDIFDNKISLAWENFKLKSLYSVDMETARKLKVGFGDGKFSSITVDTSGRSGTYQRLHCTELARTAKERPDKAKEILEGSLPAIPMNGRADFESTSEGAQGVFYDLFMGAYGKEPKYNEEFKAFFFNWTWDEEIEGISDTENNLPIEFRQYQELYKLNDRQITYYYRKFLSLNADWDALKKEYPTTPEEAFEASIKGSYYKEQLAKMQIDGRIKIVPYDEALKVHTVWDLGIGSNLVVGFFQEVFGEYRMIDCWQGEENDGILQASKMLQNKPYLYGKHFAPHDIRATEQSTGKTKLDIARGYGINFEIVPSLDIESGIEQCKLFLSNLWVDEEKCKEWIVAMKQYHKEWDDSRGIYKNKPYHDWTSHFADIARYAALVSDRMTNDILSNIPKREIQGIGRRIDTRAKMQGIGRKLNSVK